jgi:hypothetical protein
MDEQLSEAGRKAVALAIVSGIQLVATIWERQLGREVLTERTMEWLKIAEDLKEAMK